MDKQTRVQTIQVFVLLFRTHPPAPPVTMLLMILPVWPGGFVANNCEIKVTTLLKGVRGVCLTQFWTWLSWKMKIWKKKVVVYLISNSYFERFRRFVTLCLSPKDQISPKIISFQNFITILCNCKQFFLIFHQNNCFILAIGPNTRMNC